MGFTATTAWTSQLLLQRDLLFYPKSHQENQQRRTHTFLLEHKRVQWTLLLVLHRRCLHSSPLCANQWMEGQDQALCDLQRLRKTIVSCPQDRAHHHGARYLQRQQTMLCRGVEKEVITSYKDYVRPALRSPLPSIPLFPPVN